MPVWRRILILLITTTVSGCTHFYPKPIRDDVQVLHTQLAQQQEQMASQQVLLNSLLTGQQKTAEKQGLGFANLQDQMQRLLRVTSRNLASRSSSDNADTSPIVTSGSAGSGDQYSGLTPIGAVEGVLLRPPDHLFRARIDSGANTSSLDARDIEMFERDGDDYVRFTIAGEYFNDGEAVELERPVSRFVQIIQSSSSENERRAVVELQYRIGSIEKVAEFTLADRERLTYPVLIGRNILRDLFIVDVGETFRLSNPDKLPEASGDDDAEAEE